MTLYDILGVPPGASKRALRAAYREKVKTTHPDAGGDRVAFEALKKAHDVLTDDERRKKYDLTGIVDDVAADNAQAEAYTMLSMAIDQLIIECARNRASLDRFDVIQSLVHMMTKQRLEMHAHAEGLREQRGHYMRLVDGFSPLKPGSPNEMNMLVLGKIQAVDEQLSKTEHSVTVLQRALKILQSHTFKHNKMAQIA